ncbi:MAG TPA: nucleotidyltransferase domain-containing protein [Cyclobacteriaceae bacterium]|nr:nucleotidyltransferase domain-containing protein [Cyclobacteriaceae bacterium]HRX00175.1 nucleotidyltransferase domain-containing protein [Cyclobacteriaceae bacterium]
MKLYDLIANKRSEFLAICKKHRVTKLYAFGSSITSEFKEHSDIDFVVDLDIEDPIEFGETLLALWDEFESLFERRIDLLTDDSISNPFLRKSIDSTRKLVYDGQGEKVLI